MNGFLLLTLHGFSVWTFERTKCQLLQLFYEREYKECNLVFYIKVVEDSCLIISCVILILKNGQKYQDINVVGKPTI